MALIQLNEAYNYCSCTQTETNPLTAVYGMNLQNMNCPVNACNEFLQNCEGKDLKDLMHAEVIEPLIVFESNEEYLNETLESQVNPRTLKKLA